MQLLHMHALCVKMCWDLFLHMVSFAVIASRTECTSDRRAYRYVKGSPVGVRFS